MTMAGTSWRAATAATTIAVNTESLREPAEPPVPGNMSTQKKKHICGVLQKYVFMYTHISTHTHIHIHKDAYDVARGADCLAILTEWNEFKELDFRRLKKLLKQPLIVDGRNIYDPKRMRKLGFRYVGIGRGRVEAQS